MAAEFIEAMLYANLSLSAAILFVLIARAPAKRLFGPHVAYGLWMAVPLAGAASFLPAPVIHAPAVAASTDMSDLLSLPMAAVARYAGGGQAVAAEMPAFEYGSVLLLAAWVIGLIASVGILALRQKRFVASLGHLEECAHDGTTLFLCESATIGPAVVGMFAPRIVLPADFETRYSADEQMVVLAHERAHLDRGDALLNGLVALLHCLCWFNPLVHMAAHYHRRDQEMACDATVVTRHSNMRRTYAHALLKAQLAQDALPLGCYWPARSEHPLKARIALLEWSNPKPVFRWTGIAAVSISSLCMGYAAWAAQPPKIAIETAGKAGPIGIDQPGNRIMASVGRQEVQRAATKGRASPTPTGGRNEKRDSRREPAPTSSTTRQPLVRWPPPQPTDQQARVMDEARMMAESDAAQRRVVVGRFSIPCISTSTLVCEKTPGIAAGNTAQAARMLSADAAPRSKYELGFLYLTGQGVPQEGAKAVALYREAAEAGYSPAMLGLAKVLENGQGVARNKDESNNWYRRWAKADDKLYPPEVRARTLAERNIRP